MLHSGNKILDKKNKYSNSRVRKKNSGPNKKPSPPPFPTLQVKWSVLTRKLLNQRFIWVKLNSSCIHHELFTVTEYMYHK